MYNRIKFSVTLALAATAILITGCSGSRGTLEGIDEKDDKKEPSVSVGCTPESVLNDCGSGFLCAEGKCERMSCETDSDCGGTLGCIDKKCFESLVIKRRVLGTSTDGILGCEYTYNAEGQLLSAHFVSGSRNKDLTNIDIEKADSWIGLKREKAIELKYDDKKRIVSGAIDDPKYICIASDVNFYLIGNEAEKRLAGEMVRLEENKVTPPTPPSIPSVTPVVQPPYLPPLGTKDELLTTYMLEHSAASEIGIIYTNSGIIFEKIVSEKKDPADKEKVTSPRSDKYAYDANGKLTEYKYKNSDEANVTYSKAHQYEYDSKGRLKEYKYKESINGDIDIKTGAISSSKDAYTYDEEGRLTKKKHIDAASGDLDDDARVTSSIEETYTYKGDGRLVEKKYRKSDKGDLDGEADVTYSFKETYTYDNEGILTERNYKRAGHGDVDKNAQITDSSKDIYAYYSNGKLKEKKYKSAVVDDVDKNGTMQSGSMDTYFYDDSGRLTEHKSRQAATGNIDNPADITYSYKYMYTYDIKGRLAEKKYKYSYRGDVDDMGSVTSSHVYTYTYDNEGRLNEYEDKNSQSGDLDDGASINYSTKYTYTHDSNGKLKEKRYRHRGDFKNPELVTSSAVNSYTYDDEGRLIEYKDTFSNKGEIDDLKNVTTSYKKVFQTIQEKPERSQLTPSNFACSEENLFGICPTPIMSCNGGKCSDKMLIEPFKRFPEWHPPARLESLELERQYPSPSQFDIEQQNLPESIE